MPTFAEVLASLEPADGCYRTEAPEGWGQGRTLYGGMTAALMTTAARLAAADLPPLRSALFSFIGPASGLLTIRPRLLRQGKSATVMAVDLAAGEAPCAQAVLTFGAPRTSTIVHDIAQPPPCVSPENSEAFIPDGAPRPEFHQHFDLRKAGGTRPYEGGARAEYLVWGRHLEGGESVSEPGMVALADALPPAALGVAAERGAISTMTWMIDIVRQAPSEDWRLLRSLSESAADGYSQQAMEVYDADGRRLAVGRQTVALFM